MKKTVEEVSSVCKADFALALEVVTDICGVSRKKVLSKSRIDEALAGRCILYALMDYTDRHDLASVGAFFGKDHSTILHGIREHQKRYDQDYNGYQSYYDRSLELFKEKLNKEVQAMTANDQSHYEIINKIDDMINGLSVIRDAVLDDYVSGIPMSEKLKEKLVEAFFIPDPATNVTDKEKEISNNLFINKEKYV